MLKVVVNLNRDRIKPGMLAVVEDTQTVLGPFECLGKSDNAGAIKEGNPTRDPLFRNGDTPTGEWLITRLIPADRPGMTIDKFGPHGALDLEPFSGQCVQAYKNGRSGIWIHAGKPSPTGKLRPTYGCLRLANDDMKRLVAKLRPALAAGKVRLVVSLDP